MPYASMKDINPALKGIKPKITLAQANAIAKWADAMERAEDGPESPWAAAIAQFENLYRVESGKWVKRGQKESAMSYRGYFTSGSATVEINAIDVDGEAVPIDELIAAYQGHPIAEAFDNGMKEAGFTEAVAGSLEDFAMSVKDAFRVAFKPVTVSAGVEVGPELWPRDVFKDNAELGDVVVVRDNGQLYAVEYKETDDGFQFATRENWRKVMLTYIPVKEETMEMAEAQLSESTSGHAVALAEAGDLTGGPRAPLMMDVELIKPGFGNKKDKHYYPREVLERDAKVFEGVKMYATDHRPEEKNVRTEVAVIKACPVAFTDDGAPIAKVAVHDGDFAEQARNRAKLGTLDTLECSILALGRTKKGEVDGQKANIVEAITKGQSVDWVTKAGAGGHAVSLAESDTGGVKMEKEQIEKLLSESDLSQDVQERLAGAEYEDEEAVKEAILKEKAQQEKAPQKLAEADVEKAVDATKLPDFAKAALKARGYADEAELKEAVEAAVKEVAKLTGSGQPFGQGGSAAPGEGQMSEADYETAYADILTRHGLHVPQQEAN
jgi:hypothetical protein